MQFTPTAHSDGLQQRCCAPEVWCRTYEKWGNVDLFLAIKSTCCNEASGLCNVSDHLTRAQAVDFKDASLSLAGRCDEAVKRMNNHHQNMRMFIRD